MNNSNKFLNALFNNLSSIYSSNDGMVNSNLFTLFNAYASVFQNIDDIRQDTYNDTYLNLANINALEPNFSAFVDFPKPPRLNTVTNGGEIYRAILRSIYDAFLNGSTEESMDVGLSTVLSFLTIDDNTATVVGESNSVFFNTFDTSIKLAYPAISISGITILPSGLTVTNYDITTQTVTFTGSIPTSGQSYVIEYYRDHTNQINTNWINFTDPSGTSPLPTDLKTIENTYQNPKFSYWWNTYNRDENGVQIIDGALDPSDIGLVWRLPEKFITFIDPFTKKTTKSTISLYNLSGNVYDIDSSNKDVNPDYEQTTKILSYVDEVSRQPSEFYIRYSQNNNLFPALAAISGNLVQVEKVSDVSVDFFSTNIGNLDLFEKNTDFDINDLFGTGTKNIWTEVESKNSTYSLSAQNFFNRPFSLHDDILFNEFFENGNRSLLRMGVVEGSTMIAESVGTPLEDSEDCLMLYGSEASVYPVMSSGITSSGNRFQVDIFDGNLISGTSNITINFTNPSDSTVTGNTQVRFGIDSVADTVKTIVGPSGYTINNTIPHGFVDTYFTNIDDLNNSIVYPTLSVLESGNPNSNSSYHLRTSGVGTIYPKLTSLQNTDELILEISSDKSFSINWTNATTGLPSIGGYYNNANHTIAWNSSSKVFVQSGSQSYSYVTGTPPFWAVTGGGGGGVLQFVPFPSSVFKIEFRKGQIPKLNGVSVSWMPNPLDTPNLGTLGLGGTSFNFNVPQSIKIATSNSSISSKVYHYSIGNSNSKNAFYTVTNNSGYFYQLAPSGTDINNASKNIIQVPDTFGWHRVTFDFGSGLNHLTSYLDEYKFLDYTFPFSGNFGFTNDLNDSKSITLNHSTTKSNTEFSYFDNIKFSYYTPEQTRPQYYVQEDSLQDWQGSYLDQSAVISNRIFKGSRQANFTFELIIKGLQNKFLFIVENLVNKLKPAHTLADLSVQTDHVLNTTSIIPTYVTDDRNWENGNLLNSVYITDGVNADDALDLPGLITISGS